MAKRPRRGWGPPSSSSSNSYTPSDPDWVNYSATKEVELHRKKAVRKVDLPVPRRRAPPPTAWYSEPSVPAPTPPSIHPVPPHAWAETYGVQGAEDEPPSDIRDWRNVDHPHALPSHSSSPASCSSGSSVLLLPPSQVTARRRTALICPELPQPPPSTSGVTAECPDLGSPQFMDLLEQKQRQRQQQQRLLEQQLQQSLVPEYESDYLQFAEKQRQDDYMQRPCQEQQAVEELNKYVEHEVPEQRPGQCLQEQGSDGDFVHDEIVVWEPDGEQQVQPEEQMHQPQLPEEQHPEQQEQQSLPEQQYLEQHQEECRSSQKQQSHSHLTDQPQFQRPQFTLPRLPQLPSKEHHQPGCLRQRQRQQTKAQHQLQGEQRQSLPEQQRLREEPTPELWHQRSGQRQDASTQQQKAPPPPPQNKEQDHQAPQQKRQHQRTAYFSGMLQHAAQLKKRSTPSRKTREEREQPHEGGGLAVTEESQRRPLTSKLLKEACPRLIRGEQLVMEYLGLTQKPASCPAKMPNRRGKKASPDATFAQRRAMREYLQAFLAQQLEPDPGSYVSIAQIVEEIRTRAPQHCLATLPAAVKVAAPAAIKGSRRESSNKVGTSEEGFVYSWAPNQGTAYLQPLHSRKYRLVHDAVRRSVLRGARWKKGPGFIPNESVLHTGAYGAWAPEPGGCVTRLGLLSVEEADGRIFQGLHLTSGFALLRKFGPDALKALISGLDRAVYGENNPGLLVPPEVHECLMCDILVLLEGDPRSGPSLLPAAAILVLQTRGDRAPFLSFVHYLGVAPAFQRRGIATRLLSLISDPDDRPSLLEVHRGNEAARLLYRKTGFVDLGESLRDSEWLSMLRPGSLAGLGGPLEAGVTADGVDALYPGLIRKK